MSKSATQTALLVNKISQPLVLSPNHPIPQPNPNQIQIRISVAGLNPTDQYSRDNGLIISDKLPAILGKDVVGEVSKLGENVTGFEIGDRVMARADIGNEWKTSALQEYAVADAECVGKIPDGVGDDEAATLPTNLSTNFGVFFITLGLTPPWDPRGNTDAKVESILIIGGGSACGQFSVQVASQILGVEKLIVVGGDEKELKNLGATDVIDRHRGEDEIVKQIKEILGQEELRYAVDTVNFPQGLGLGLKALTKGKLARLLPMGVIDEETRRGNEVLDVFGNNYFRDPVIVEMWKRLPGYLEKKQIIPTRYEVREPRGLRADVVNAALDDYRDGKKVVKPHIHVRS